MESAQLILDFSLYIVWYGFFTLFIFDFLVGLLVLAQQTFEAPAVQSIQTSSQSALPVFDELVENLSTASIIPLTNSDEVTIQYLQMVGADIDDFESIAEARKFLDEHAPWAIEELPVQSEPQLIESEVRSILPVPDPWFDLSEELCLVETKAQPIAPKATKKGTNKRKQFTEANPSPSTELQVTKLTFNQVCIEFAEIGLALERYRSGHYCYRVVFGHNSPCRFKTLQEAVDWLAVSKQAMPTVTAS
jgi:hypothetical protein